MEWDKVISKAFDWIARTEHILAALIVVGAMIFLPNSALEQLGISDLATEWKPYLSIGFIFLAAILIAPYVLKTFRTLALFTLPWKHLPVFRNLTPQEKEILTGYISENTHTQVLPYNSGVVQGLVSKGILVRMSDISHGSIYFDYNIHLWAFKYLKKHPKYLKETT